MGGRPKDTLESIQQNLDARGREITVSGEYVNQKTKLNCTCNLCHYTWITTASNLKSNNGRGCVYCSRGTIRSVEHLQSQLDSLNKNFTLLSESERNYYYNVRCNDCKREWVSDSSSLKLNGCASCSGKLKGSLIRLQEKLDDKKARIEVSGEYVNALTKINCKCLLCGVDSHNSPHNLSYHGCPFCCFKGRIPKDRSAHLYYIRIDYEDTTYWKIGITTKSNILGRFSKDLKNKKITLLYSHTFDNGEDAYFCEKNILRLYKNYIVPVGTKILTDGNTEIFCCDVLQMNHLEGSTNARS